MTHHPLLDPVTLGGLELPNRVAVAPMSRVSTAGDGVPTPQMADYFAAFAAGGFGLVLTDGTYLDHAHSQAYPDQPAIVTDEQVRAWARVTDAVHAAGGRIFLQLMHAGALVQGNHHCDEPIAPSAVLPRGRMLRGYGGGGAWTMPREATREDIRAAVAAFAASAARARTAGFDGVEVHAANGYLLDQFLKTGSNQRNDDYGGSIENRARLLLEAMRAVVDAVGGGRTGIRISPVTPANDVHDENPQPLFEYVVKQLAALDLAYIHVVEGATGGPRELEDRPFDYEALKAAYRRAGGKGAWMVNNGYDKPLAEEALKEGDDLVAFGKPFISNPDLVRRLREGAPLNPWDKNTFYGGGAKGYIDYPALG
jgi:N-ethylmaleimide reductase